jgi:dynamin GTPase
MAMEGSLIALVNRLQTACSSLGDLGVDSGDLPSLYDALPQIAVVGGQSAGKSSVLEAIVGKDFLPRNAGICTRRPLVINLQKAPEGTTEEYGEFAHRKGERLTSFLAVRQEIEAETERAVGAGSKNVSPVPIFLTICSPNVVNLTLVDLPGLTKVAVEGQPESTVREIEQMVRKYVARPNCVMLTVSPANADLANSDGLRMAKDVDPSGERTFGVLTKLDLMDEGTDSRAILDGQTYSTRFPFVGVVNRSQKDIMGNMDMASARRKEAEYFKTHSAYGDIADRMGTAHLAKALSHHLGTIIRDKIPSINALIARSSEKIREELRILGSPVPLDNRGDMLYEVLELSRFFDREFGAKIDREGAGEQLYFTFNTKLGMAIDALPIDRTLSLPNVARVVQQADGYNPHLIAPEQGYRRLIEHCLRLLKAPVESAVHEVASILLDVTRKVAASEELQRFGVLRTRILAAAEESLTRFRDEARRICVVMVEMQSAHLTAEFFRKLPMEPDVKAVTGQSGLDARTEAYLRRIASNVAAYYEHVADTLKVTVPKAIVHCQVNKAKAAMLDAFYVEVGGNEREGLRELLSEDPATVARREKLSTRLTLLKTAQEDINATVL